MSDHPLDDFFEKAKQLELYGCDIAHNRYQNRGFIAVDFTRGNELSYMVHREKTKAETAGQSWHGYQPNDREKSFLDRLHRAKFQQDREAFNTAIATLTSEIASSDLPPAFKAYLKDAFTQFRFDIPANQAFRKPTTRGRKNNERHRHQAITMLVNHHRALGLKITEAYEVVATSEHLDIKSVERIYRQQQKVFTLVHSPQIQE